MIGRLKKLWTFATEDIFRLHPEQTRLPRPIVMCLKAVNIAVTGVIERRLTQHAASLTYSTLLALVPILALLFAIARGFGLDNMLEYELMNGIGGPKDALTYVFQFVNSYLERTRGGIFVGVGVIMLFFTVLNLISNIETTFNTIWHVNKERTYFRKVTDYFSLLLMLPILLVTSGGLTIFTTSVVQHLSGLALLGPLAKFLVDLSPYVLTWLMFTGLYIFMPNTKVRFINALIAGFIAGTAFQLFQYLYINSQIWVSSYNAVYGSFAALPLLLLWLQISWIICLVGAELTYAGQNIHLYDFYHETASISRSYSDYVSLLVMSVFCKGFERGESPLTAEDISDRCNLPIRLAQDTINRLEDMHLLSEIQDSNAWQPALDISRISVALVLERLNNYGSNNFATLRGQAFAEQWNKMKKEHEEFCNEHANILVKDMPDIEEGQAREVSAS